MTFFINGFILLIRDEFMKKLDLKVFFLGGTIARRLIIFLLIGIVLPLTLITFLNYKNIYKKMVDQYANDSLGSISYISYVFDDYYSSVKELSYKVFDSNDRYMVYAMTEEVQENSELDNILLSRAKAITFSRDDIVNLNLYTRYNNRFTSFENSTISFTSSHRITKDELKEKFPYYEKMSPEKMFLLSEMHYKAPEAKGYRINTLNQLMMDCLNKDMIAMLSIDLTTDVLDNKLKDLILRDGEFLLVLDEDFNLIYSKIDDADKYINTLKTLKLKEDKGIEFATVNNFTDANKIASANSEEILLAYVKMKDNPYYLYRIIPAKKLYQVVNSNIVTNYLVSGLFIVFLIVLIVVISNSSALPIKKITESMNKMEKGQFDVKINYTTYDSQFSTLINKFNQMADEINTLFNEKYKLQLAQTSAELKALQTQINPHFLYNTLQTMQYMALKRNAFEIDAMITALADILGYSFKNQNAIVTLGEEMHYVDKYLLIQSYKYNNLKVSLNFDEATTNIKMPKMIIQPLIENSLKHGYDSIIECFEINIKCIKCQNEIIIEVADNGKGINENSLKELQSTFNREGSINNFTGEDVGLKSIYTRMKIIYNSGFDFKISSTPYVKTAFTISIFSDANLDQF